MESGEDTGDPGGFQKNEEADRREGGGQVIFIQFIQSRLLLTPAVHWTDTTEFRDRSGLAQRDELEVQQLPLKAPVVVLNRKRKPNKASNRAM